MKLCIHCGDQIKFFQGSTTTRLGPLHVKCWAAFHKKRESDLELSDSEPTRKQSDLPTAITDQKIRSGSGTAYPTKYGVARVVSGFGQFLGWILVAIGIILLFISAAEETGVAGFLVALGISVSGLYLVMMAQFVHATVDNADSTREILRLMQKKA